MIKNIFILLFTFLFYTSYSQNLSTEQELEIKNELKALMKNPEKFLALKQESEEKTSIISKQSEDIAKLEKENIILQTDNKTLQDKLSMNNAEIKTEVKSEPLTDATEKIYQYSIQIGAFKNFDISQSLSDAKVIYVNNQDGINKYFVGNFETKKEADAFADNLKKLGIKGAFIVKGRYEGDYSDVAKNASYYSSYTPNTYNSGISNTGNRGYSKGKKVNFSIDEIRNLTNTTSVESLNFSNKEISSSSSTTKSDSTNIDSVIYLDNE